MSVRTTVWNRLGTPWAKMLLHGGVLAAVFYTYMRLIESFGGFSAANFQQQVIEFGLVLYLYGLFYIALKPWWGRSVLAVLPLLLAYLVHDIFYLAFGKVFRLINISEFPELLQILPLGYSLLLLTALLLPSLLYLAKVDYRWRRRLVLWLMPLLIIVIGVKLMPQAFARGFEQVAGVVKYSDGKSVENNGRLAMLAYREAQRTIALDKLKPYHDRKGYERQAAALTAALQPVNTRRNIHLIVLESFLDPRLFRELGFSEPPVHPAFDALFGDNLGLSVSPVFGGATAQAEFEVLCGVPAFERLSSVEFNVFSGADAQCLPGTLQRLGYRSVATNTYKPNFFNALPAYQGMGFSDSYFPQEFTSTQASYLHVGDPGFEEYIFDRSLFEQNLDFIQSHRQQHPGQPLFNYVLTIYGHTPHLLNPSTRPEFIELNSDYPDDHLSRSVNQFYYRTEAIADYVNKLLEIDKESLIILISDHVPPLRNGPNTYRALRYMDNREDSYFYNRLAILEDGKAKVYPAMHHYDMPSLVLNYLSGGKYCQDHDCDYLSTGKHKEREDYMEQYMRLMAHAVD